MNWTLASIVTDLQSEDKTFYQIFRLDVLLEDFIVKLENWESEFGVDQVVDDIRDHTPMMFATIFGLFDPFPPS